LGRRLGDRGELILGDVVRIEWKTRSLIPEPRCAELLPQRALRVLAEHSKGLAARDLAEHLSVPLRTAQRALRELVEDGSLLSETRGRGVLYRVEDTTFSEPTMSRVFR
ncbi:MAG: helix-turn-helix domain-containing protein, partial [Myxococcota bacterium]